MKAKILSKPFCFNATRSFSHHSALALWILMMMMMRCFPTLSVAPRRPFGNVIVRGYRQRSSVARFDMKVPTFSVRPCSSQVWSARQAPLVDDKHENRFLSIRGGETRPFSVARQHVDMSSDDTLHRAFIAVGSNLGDRHANIESALELLCDSNWQQHDSKNHSDAIVRLVQTSYLHETEPMYVTNQPNFLNGVVEVVTNLSPHALLRRIKHVEHALGRDFNTVRNGPRPVDLDIVLFERRSKDKELEQLVLNTPDLVIPHVGMSEREFVLKPLCELVPAETLHPVLNQTVGDLLERLLATQAASDEESSVRVLPLPRGRMLHFNETIIMGILNVTPDSFSDGGKLKGSVDTAVQAALEMEQNGAGIIDIGGESTRPGAKEILVVEEMNRTIPVIRGIRKVSYVPISIDTRHSEVARAAVEAGADIVNDVSGGTFDPLMLGTVAELQVPMILMHMRGTPETMQTMTDYDDVVSDVAAALLERSRAAEYAGIPRWMQVLDPGIGFAKDLRGNLLLLRNVSTLRLLLRDYPILLGTSRKGFIGKIANVTEPTERDFGTIASCVAALCLDDNNNDGCNILRVHNVKGMKQGAMVMDAVKRAK